MILPPLLNYTLTVICGLTYREHRVCILEILFKYLITYWVVYLITYLLNYHITSLLIVVSHWRWNCSVDHTATHTTGNSSIDTSATRDTHAALKFSLRLASRWNSLMMMMMMIDVVSEARQQLSVAALSVISVACVIVVGIVVVFLAVFIARKRYGIV